jgi:hypothetical protein
MGNNSRRITTIKNQQIFAPRPFFSAQSDAIKTLQAKIKNPNIDNIVEIAGKIKIAMIKNEVNP